MITRRDLCQIAKGFVDHFLASYTDLISRDFYNYTITNLIKSCGLHAFFACFSHGIELLL